MAGLYAALFSFFFSFLFCRLIKNTIQLFLFLVPIVVAYLAIVSRLYLCAGAAFCRPDFMCACVVYCRPAYMPRPQSGRGACGPNPSLCVRELFFFFPHTETVLVRNLGAEEPDMAGSPTKSSPRIYEGGRRQRGEEPNCNQPTETTGGGRRARQSRSSPSLQVAWFAGVYLVSAAAFRVIPLRA